MQNPARKAEMKLRRKVHLDKNYTFYKSLSMNQMLPAIKRWAARGKLSKFGRRGSYSTFTRHCIITGRAKSVDRYSHLSRHMFRKLASDGQLPGIRKSSW